MRVECPRKKLLRGAKRRAKAKGRIFELTLEDIQIPSTCPVLGIPLVAGGDPKNSPSIDRIDNTKGYTKDNIIIVSYQANVTRHNSTPDEILKVGNFYKKLECGTTREEKLEEAFLTIAEEVFDPAEVAELKSCLYSPKLVNL